MSSTFLLPDILGHVLHDNNLLSSTLVKPASETTWTACRQLSQSENRMKWEMIISVDSLNIGVDTSIQSICNAMPMCIDLKFWNICHHNQLFFCPGCVQGGVKDAAGNWMGAYRFTGC